MSQHDGLDNVQCYLQTVDKECHATWHRTQFCCSLSVGYAMRWPFCCQRKCDLLAISHGMGWDEPVQYNSRTHPLAQEMRYYCLYSKCTTPLTFFLLWDKIRPSGRKKCRNTYILPNIIWGMNCDEVMCQRHDSLSIGREMKFDE